MSITLPSSLADGRYLLGQLVGRGGMAEVHKAVDTRLGRTVAVKIMRSDLANDEVFLSRFRREAHSVALLNNPNIVSIYDSGEELLTDDQGNHERVPYLVMEYVKGQTLRSILKENGALSQRDSEQVMLGMLNALEYSHHMGVIHRDIKPGNIMISEQGIVKVMDFGIARAMDDSAATITQTQGVVGTAQYLSPEQARGASVDMRSDIYSAGCVLYEMLTGQPPFNGDSAVAIALQHVNQMATPPSTIVPGLPKMWDSICAKAMAKDRQNRYATAAAFKSDILAFMNGGTPVAAAFNPLTDLANVKARRDAEQGTETATMPLTEEETAATQAFNPVQDPLNPAAASVATAERTATRKAQQKSKRRKKIIIGAVLGAVLLVAIGLGAWTFMSRNRHPMAEVPTINAQMSRALVRDKVTAAGFQYQEKEDQDSAEPKGTFTKQSPKGGSMAPKGSTVTVWFSSGPKDTAIPDVKGMNQQEARRALEKAGFKVSPAASVEDSQDVPKDHVTRTDPAAGQSVAKGTSILLYISSGMTKVPDLSGKTKDDATKILESLHFNITISEQTSNSVSKDMVISTDPAAGSSIQQGAMITVNVSNGMQLDDYAGRNMTLGEVKRALGQGVNITVNGPNSDNAVVTGQTPAAGTSFDKSKDTITLTTRISIPSFSGETLGSYRQKLINSGVSADRINSSGKDSDTVTGVNPGVGSRVDDNTPIMVATGSSAN
ncbi:Stk1 family PASTA domain-containing Ser/Thr kinase [Bifidobacterium asteroides]|uniref:non-specific serine/threonine protein kinase n=1 Tax=Bifidobacterium asteroides TaxID=1684 RepID=A0A318MI16_9BIFI|nr:Stk1 family PASTA domain-containing Ser/Thr kinase [Bifidobacterium asteroides]PXY85664.1 Stk1 family PASTA domain-containing Ser/Thr kinase [Bifidobacterium asteroides]